MKYYKRVLNGQTTTVESYSHNLPVLGAVEIDQKEFDDYIKALPPPPSKEKSDIEKRLNQLELELTTIKEKIK